MSKKGTGKATTAKVTAVSAKTVEFLLQAAYVNNAESTMRVNVDRSEFSPQFTEGKIINLTGAKGSVVIAAIEAALVAELTASKDGLQGCEIYNFLKGLPEQICPNLDRCNALFRYYRTATGSYEAVKLQVLKCNKIFDSCYSIEQNGRNDAILVLHEGITALLWLVLGSSFTPLKDVDHYSSTVQLLVDRAILPTDSNVYRMLMGIKEKIPVPTAGAGKKPAKKTNSEANPPVAQAGAADAADILDTL